MAQVSAGLLMYRRNAEGDVEVLVVHPGGPFYARKDEGAWSVPKGLVDEGEDPLACARREFVEELGQPCGDGPFLPLGEVVLKSRKRVIAWAVEGEIDTERVVSNTFELEWPPRSGRRATFPEVDRAAFLPPEEAKRKLNPAQAPFVDRLLDALAKGAG